MSVSETFTCPHDAAKKQPVETGLWNGRNRVGRTGAKSLWRDARTAFRVMADASRLLSRRGVVQVVLVGRHQNDLSVLPFDHRQTEGLTDLNPEFSRGFPWVKQSRRGQRDAASPKHPIRQEPKPQVRGSGTEGAKARPFEWLIGEMNVALIVAPVVALYSAIGPKLLAAKRWLLPSSAIPHVLPEGPAMNPALMVAPMVASNWPTEAVASLKPTNRCLRPSSNSTCGESSDGLLRKVTADAVFGVGDEPNGRNPLFHAERGILKDRADLS